MKKLLAISILATLSIPAMANTSLDISQISNSETELKAGYGFDNGLKFGGELVFKDGLKELKEGTVAAAWRFDITTGFYVEPQLAYTMPHKGKVMETITNPDPLEGGVTHLRGEYETGNTFKVGLKTGYDFDNGFSVAARYRYDMRKDDAKLVAVSKGKRITDETLGGTSPSDRVHRTDLTLGYSFDFVDLSANWVHKQGEVKINHDAIDKAIGKQKYKADDYEFKAAFTKAGNFIPYAQYTVKTLEGKSSDIDNQFKVGINYRF